MMDSKTEQLVNLEFLFNHTRDVIWSIDRDMNLVCSNRAFDEFFKRITGKDPIPGQSISIAEFGEETNAFWQMQYKRVLAGEHFSFELEDERSINPYNEVTFNPIVDENGVVIGAGCNTRDITAYKLKEIELQRAHKELQNSEERYRAMIQSSSDIILLADEQGNRTYISPAVKTMLGYEPEELLGQPVFDHIHPDDLPYIYQVYNDVVADPKKQTPTSLRFMHKNGTWRHLHIMGSNQFNNPAVGAMVANIRDVTEQVEAQQKLEASEKLYRSLAENFPNGNIGVLDLDLNFRYLAGGDLKLYDIDAAALIGTNYISNFEAENQAFVKAKMAQVLNGKQITFQVPFGGFIYIVSAVPLYDSQNNINEVLVVAQNITQLKRVEDALRESEEKFRMLGEHSPVGIFQVAPNGYCTWMNERMCKIFDFEMKDGLGFGYLKYFHPEDNKRIQQSWMEFIGGGDSAPLLTYRILTKDRQIRWVSTHGAPLRNNNGEIVAYVGTVENVSEIKHYQDELVASRKQLEIVLSGMPDGVVFFDNEWVITYVNDSAVKILGMPQHDMLGWIMWERFPEAVNTEFQKYYLDAKAQDIPFSFTGFYAPLNKWLELRGVPHNEGFLVYFRDVTEQMELEQHMQRIYEMSPAMLGIVDKNMHFANFNPALSHTLGYSDEELKEKPFYEFVYPDDRTGAVDSAKVIMKTHGYTRNFENRFQTKNGDYKWISWTVYGLPERNLAYFVAHDVTHKKEMQAERERYQEQLEQTVQKRTAQLQESNDELEAFNYTVSHDLRTPIRAMQMFVTLLERECIEKETCKEYTQSIKVCTDEMSTLIHDMLQFSRLRRQPLNLVTINMEQTAKETVAYLLSLETRKDVNVKIGKLQPINGDLTLMKSVWQNIISNAIKYSNHSKPAKITISSKVTEGMVEFCVQDNGVGFEMKYAPKLFKPFSRLHSGSEYKGTGAGLAIVERIVSRHGGKVAAQSEPNKGSKFYFSLPLPN